jgi:hypothetical protein
MFNPDAFIDVSRSLSSDGRNEAEYRTAIGRALYGVFLRAREELEVRGARVKVSDPSRRGDEHGNVRAQFKKGGKFPHDKVSQRFGSLYELRYTSDYDLDATVNQQDVLQALEYVKYIKEAFATTLFKNPPHA